MLPSIADLTLFKSAQYRGVVKRKSNPLLTFQKQPKIMEAQSNEAFSPALQPQHEQASQLPASDAGPEAQQHIEADDVCSDRIRYSKLALVFYLRHT